MLALIVTDNSFATREHAMLSRLEVGLADEGVRVIHAGPVSPRPSPTPTLGIQSTSIQYHPPALRLGSLARRSARDLLAAVDLTSDDEVRIDLVHAFGESCWEVALEAARTARAALLIELWHPGLVPAAARLLARSRRDPGGPTPEFLTSEASVASAMIAMDARARVYSAPWGVHVPERRRAMPVSGTRGTSIAMLYDTCDPRTLLAPLAGVAQAIAADGDAMIVAAIEESNSRREFRLWSAARRVGLLDRFTILSDMEARRDPVLAMDFLLIPEARGRQRTLILDAMARGAAVVATPDPALELLSKGGVAQLVAANAPKAWADAVGSLMRDSAALADLTNAAHHRLRSSRAASSQIADTLRAYRQTIADQEAATVA